MKDNTLVDLIRHGEPVGGRRYRGQIDDPLSERGWQQMWAAVEVPGPWQEIISSPLTRCSAFARSLSERLALPYREEPRIMEVGFGSWEGKTGEELRRLDPDTLSRFYHDPVLHRPRDAEPLDAFRDRVVQAFDEILVRHRGQHVLLVTHAGVIRAVIAHVMGAPLGGMYRISVANASLARIRADAERPPTLMFHGRQSL